MNREPFRDLRKHINDMTSYEIQVIRNAIVVAKNNSRIRVPNHLKDRLRQKYITMEDVANTIERGHIIEAHIIDYSFRVLLRLHKEGTNKDVCVVVELVGHGVGTKLHEEPEVPNYGTKNTGPLLKEGMVIAVEPMLNLGTADIYILDDDWTIVTGDDKPSAHFEHTVLVTKDGYTILTERWYYG